ncbi:RnfABCDGE type electron transport complex subunit D [Desulfovibrio ferrophilus]|uniref:RnfABCDGE type electron transport complex subunit D n=1 Tax=Desulfovibrio ferrophilus TaxID=241368 RepID=A0A2Z6AVY9_9BACT|nr:RnfABCDGE type electron transport complex subunit D [Desulfovibrio ferrophilus]BBD07380.1 RnfABCDGE type electron transport complex subunit D [Desulfovibrio ferrophilus]
MTPPVIKPLADSAGALVVCPPPHVRTGLGVRGLSLAGLLALAPAAIMAMGNFGLDAARVLALAGSVAVLTEALCLRLAGRDVDVDNFSALYAGLLFAFLLPASAPWWLVAMGAILTTSLGRVLFGGFGSNPLCAPLVAWAMCRISWPAAMDVDFAMAASAMHEPLAQLKYFGVQALDQFEMIDLLLGRHLGALGAVQIIPLALGGVALMVFKVIRPYIPLAFLAGVLGMAGLLHMIDPSLYAEPVFHLLTGSVVFGAFFLATDTASSPVGRMPMILFGLMAGVMVVVIRAWGVYTDGVPFAILLVNLLSPLLDRVRPKPFGAR